MYIIKGKYFRKKKFDKLNSRYKTICIFFAENAVIYSEFSFKHFFSFYIEFKVNVHIYKVYKIYSPKGLPVEIHH